MGFEAGLARLRAGTADPRAGLFGPDSKLWEVNRHSVIFLGAGRAALLQLAHPLVARAIREQSRTRSDPIGRFRRTFLRMFAMVYGDLDSALRAARCVRASHDGIAGADDLEALLWVHATLWDTSVRLFERTVRPLGADEKDRYWQETRRFAALFGIPDAALPGDWQAFRDYCERTYDSSALQVSDAAAETAAFLFRPLHATLAPLTRWYGKVTGVLLPPRLARDFGLAPSAEDRSRVERSLARIGRSERHWPERLRYLPPYLAAQRRVAGRTRADPLGALLERVLVGR